MNGQARVILYTRASCHLCGSAQEIVADVCDPAAVPWLEVDVDTDPALVAQYGDYVPVVTVDGQPQGFWQISGPRLARALGLTTP